ncbi:hypothetical protein [Mesorhizobium sp. B2-4-6]|uniref:hypothetical protein n=1 Tax=Mesorhizobium sp. B2-4-6 TaxID=2589943 RepID=UPI00112A55DB|nr:hypothetical protein [Mesorhizobium sp. B2-4-6]TPL51523.1 hypothetical protein FJ957_08005 [Mesorhizobium sp. B2-4-6]
MRKILVPIRDEPDFPIEFNFMLSAETAERLRIRRDIILVVDETKEHTDDDRGVLRLKMADQSGVQCAVARVCSPASWPQQRDHALDFPQEAAASLLREWNPMGPRIQQS